MPFVRGSQVSLRLITAYQMLQNALYFSLNSVWQGFVRHWLAVGGKFRSRVSIYGLSGITCCLINFVNFLCILIKWRVEYWILNLSVYGNWYNYLTVCLPAAPICIVLLVMLNVDTIFVISKLACVSMKRILEVSAQRMDSIVLLHMAQRIFVYQFLKWERKRKMLWNLAVFLGSKPAVLIN